MITDLVSSWKRFTRTGVFSKGNSAELGVYMGPKLGPISTLDQEIPPFVNTKVRPPGHSAESVFSGHFVRKWFQYCFNLPGTNRATVGREEGLQGQSPPQRPICSSRRSYIPAAVLTGRLRQFRKSCSVAVIG